jgi:hypothetical protein
MNLCKYETGATSFTLVREPSRRIVRADPGQRQTETGGVS